MKPADARAQDVSKESPRELVDDAAGKLLDYSRLILRYRNLAGLTSLRSRRQVEQVLIAESLQLLRLLPAGQEDTLADVGAGAGVPGIVLAIAEPALKLSLFERSSRKAAFLRIAVAELGLSNAQVVEKDVALLPDGAFEFRAVASRGAVPLPRLLPLAAKLLVPGGRLLGFTRDERRLRTETRLGHGFEPDRVLNYCLSNGRSGFVYALTFSGEAR